MNGISIRKRNIQSFDTSITVKLSSGINILEASVTNVTAFESLRKPLHVNYSPQKPIKEKLYFIGIGIDKFRDGTHNLYWSVKDIKDLADSLKKKYKNNLVVYTLFNERVTSSNIKALKDSLMKTSHNDKVILSYSGHGLLSDSFDYYLSTYDVDFKNPSVNGFPYEGLENLLDGIGSRKKLMLIDACHSGQVDKEEMQKLLRTKVVLQEKGVKFKGGEVYNNDSSAFGMKNSFELMQQLFLNVGRSTGAIIISAAGGTQLAREGGGLKNGVFTYSILEYMQINPSSSVTELKDFVNKRVPELTNGLQQPTTRSEPISVNWKVW